ncbi:unnamed protein product [Mytilus coruscus]|uniref:Uncharacterized protein n=1 Tax=Mytilus coruscus TaxID=42192 RepID=A0A6J8A3U6_MYTCO|nr:unnamed protein product [Mytilus coruscus]
MVLITIIVITCISLRRWLSENCETSCIERWNNLHRRNPLDFKTWKTTLCPLFGYSNCTYPFKITLVDTSEFVFHDTCPKSKLSRSNSMWGSYILYANLKQHATEYQRYKNDNKEIEYYFHGVYINRINIPFDRTNAAELNNKTENNNVNKSLRFTYKAYNTYRSETVRKRTTIFSLHHFIEDPEILIRPLVFQLLGTNESDPLPLMDLSQLLTFVIAVDFKTNCFEFSNLTPLQENLSIDKELFGTNIYISEDDKTLIESDLVNDTDITNRYVTDIDNTENPKKIAILAAGRHVDANICNFNNTYRTCSGVMLFYNNYGIKSVTSNFVLKINKLSQEYLSKITSVKRNYDYDEISAHANIFKGVHVLVTIQKQYG